MGEEKAGVEGGRRRKRRGIGKRVRHTRSPDRHVAKQKAHGGGGGGDQISPSPTLLLFSLHLYFNRSSVARVKAPLSKMFSLSCVR